MLDSESSDNSLYQNSEVNMLHAVHQVRKIDSLDDVSEFESEFLQSLDDSELCILPTEDDMFHSISNLASS